MWVLVLLLVLFLVFVKYFIKPVEPAPRKTDKKTDKESGQPSQYETLQSRMKELSGRHRKELLKFKRLLVATLSVRFG